MRYCLQEEKDSCGSAVVRTLLSYFHHCHNYLYLPLEHGTCHDFFSISETMRKYGVTARGMKTQEIVSLRQEKYPVLIRVKRHELFHFIVILKKSKKSYKIYDPEYGISWIKYEIVEKEMCGEFMEFIVEKKMKVPREQYISFSLITTNFIFSFFALSSLLLGLFFINETIPLASIFLLLGGILSVIQKIFLQYLGRVIDKKVIISKMSENTASETKYRSLVKFKSLWFKKYNDVLLTCFSIVTALVIVIINDYKVFYLLMIMSLIIISIKLLFQNIEKIDLKEIGTLENEMLKEKNHKNVAEVFSRSYRYASISFYKEIIIYFFDFAGLLFITFSYEMDSLLNYFIFYCFFTIFYISNFIKLLSFDDVAHEYMSAYNLINR